MPNTADAGLFAGQVGSTRRRRTTVWCGSCGAWYGAKTYSSINASDAPTLAAQFSHDGFAGIHTVRCPRCGDEYVVEAPLVIHVPSRRRLVLVIPDSLRHIALQARADLLRDVADDPGDVLPDYALEPALAVGALGLSVLLSDSDGGAQGGFVYEGGAPPLEDFEPRVVSGAWDSKSTAAPETANVPIGEPEVVEPPFGDRASEHGAVEAEVEVEVEPGDSAVRLFDIGEAEVPRVDAAADARAAMDRTQPADAIDLEEAFARTSANRRSFAEIEAELDAELDAEFGEVNDAIESGDEIDAVASIDAPVDIPAVASIDAPVDVHTIPPAGDSSTSNETSSVPAEGPLSTSEVASEFEPTHVVPMSQVAGAPGPRFDPDAAGGAGGYVRVVDDRVVAAAQMCEARGQAFLDGPPKLWFQLHRTTAGAVIDLLMVRTSSGSGPTTIDDHFEWVLDRRGIEHADVLGRLSERFEVEVVLFDEDCLFQGRRTFTRPLEDNVRAALVEADAHDMSVDSSADPAAVRRVFEADDFDWPGRMSHGFHARSFSEIRTATEALFALGIATYWSAPERRQYLTYVRAFPVTWFREICHRVVSGALEFGLAMAPHMRQLAIDLGFASDPAALLRRSLANFAEVNLNLKPNDLDALDIWDNWESLLAYAEELEIRVDEEIEELAALAMEKAREAAQATDPIEINADEESIEVEEVTDLTDLSVSDFLTLLDDRDHRVEAALNLIHRGDSVYVPAIFDTVKVMSRDELLRVVPAALAMGPAFESSFLTGLKSQKTGLRLASALFLSEIRSERAAAPLLANLAAAAESEWSAIARAAARMGRRILAPAVRHIREHGDEHGRVAFALALLGQEARGALGAALDEERTDEARAALQRALDLAGEVSFGDAADFGERLVDAFSASGPDALGPDFEEDLESLEIGPGHGIEGLDVDLESIDGPRSGKH